MRLPPLLAGIVMGAAGAMLAARALASELPHVRGDDPLTFVAVAAALLIIALAAAFIPARRAAALDPTRASRAN